MHDNQHNNAKNRTPEARQTPLSAARNAILARGFTPKVRRFTVQIGISATACNTVGGDQFKPTVMERNL